MTIAYWCVLVAAAFPYLMIGVAKIGVRGFDNRRPRDWYEKSTGFRRRAVWAQQNSFEIFPFFAAAVIIAQLAGGNQAAIDGLAIAFIASRIAYAISYLADLHLLRSLVWTAGFACCVALFIVAA
ncbi:MAG: MAPEG family protein [Wenzhouxiangella sp.]